MRDTAPPAPRPTRSHRHRPRRTPQHPRPGPPPRFQHTPTPRTRQLLVGQVALDPARINAYGEHRASVRYAGPPGVDGNRVGRAPLHAVHRQGAAPNEHPTPTDTRPNPSAHRMPEIAALVGIFNDAQQHGHEVLAGVKATATGADYLHGPISADLRESRIVGSVLARAAEMRDGWLYAVSVLATAPPGPREIYLERARRLHNSDGWRYSEELSSSGAALARAAAHLTDRIGTNVPPEASRVHAAQARSAPNSRSASAAPAPVLPPQGPTTGHRTR